MPVDKKRWDELLTSARDIGKEHGLNAASWVFDGNTTEDTYRRTLDGIEDGDPEILDMLPAPDLSGQWADGYTPRQLAEDIGLDEESEFWLDDSGTICLAYEDGFYESSTAEVERVARYHLEPR